MSFCPQYPHGWSFEYVPKVTNEERDISALPERIPDFYFGRATIDKGKADFSGFEKGGLIKIGGGSLKTPPYMVPCQISSD